jgi:hypothetical protein
VKFIHPIARGIKYKIAAGAAISEEDRALLLSQIARAGRTGSDARLSAQFSAHLASGISGNDYRSRGEKTEVPSRAGIGPSAITAASRDPKLSELGLERR